MKIILMEILGTHRYTCAGQLLRLVLIGFCVARFAAAPATVDAGPGAVGGIVARKAGCQKVVLRGEIAAGHEWRAVLGEGWVFRVMPIVSPSVGSAAAGQSYTGWDLGMDREKSEGYPDALLLATPPYGSVNEREIGTTFGMRAQDAIAWEPRRFHFFTSARSVARARVLFRDVMHGAGGSALSKRNQASNSSEELLALISSDSEMGHGEFSIVDAKLVAGAGDPPAFALPWTAHFSQVPHTLEQVSKQASTHPRGELRSIQFATTLWLPATWKLASQLRSEAANCAE